MTRLLIFITLITSIIFVPSLASKPKGDKAGSKDHPLVQRYKGSRIVGYNYSDFDQYDLVVGVKERGKKTPTKALEGKITSIIYETADNKESLLKVFRNFEIAFKKAGLEKLYSCVNNDCGKGMPKEVFGNKRVRGRYLGLDPWNMGNSINYHFWNGVLKRGDESVYVSLIANARNFGKFPVSILLDIVEVAEMEADLVKLNPKYIKDQLSQAGRVVLSGVEFDTDRDTLKSSSSEALKTIATYLRENPSANVYIVGHTDNQGKYAYNKDLSERRAHTVIKSLVSSYQIEAKRLTAIGIADVSPVISNNQTENRAKNRRVEMVLR